MLKIESIQRLDLGIQGENLCRAIEIDCGLWKALYPNGTVSIYHKRPGDTAPDVTQASYDNETGILRWEPTGDDTFYHGTGEAEIRITEDNVIKKAVPVETLIHEAVVNGEGGTIESNLQAYINEVDRLKNLAQQASADTETYTRRAEQADEAASESAGKAATSAENAHTSAMVARIDSAEAARQRAMTEIAATKNTTTYKYSDGLTYTLQADTVLINAPDGTTHSVKNHAKGWANEAAVEATYAKDRATEAAASQTAAAGSASAAAESARAAAGSATEAAGSASSAAQSAQDAKDFKDYMNDHYAGIADDVSGLKTGKADKADTVLDTTLSRGRKAGSAVGEGSFAFGNNVTASGQYSHAEGTLLQDLDEGTSAITDVGGIASGDYAHSEGASIASGQYAHSEGSGTKASGVSAHAEGTRTTAAGNYSHAEGRGNTASGLATHVFGTWAENQNSSAAQYQKGQMVEIVGNGTGDAARSNARTLDWNGNETLAGDLTIKKGTANETSVAGIAEQVNQANDSLASYMAIYSRNLGDIEGTVEEVAETAQRADAVADDLEAALTELDNALEGTSLSRWSRLNRPNLLKQNFWTYHALLERNIVYGNASRWSGTSTPYWRSFNNPTQILDHSTTAPTAEQIAAACAYYQTQEEEDGPFYHDLWQDDDDWQVSVDDLAAADQITEVDGEVYDKAIRLAITENSAYGNTEVLSFNNPYTTRWYRQGETNVTNYGHIEEMTPGETYTMSCWARVVSGGDVWCRMGWGTRLGNRPVQGGTNQDISDWIVISGSAWKRYSWTFTFNPTGDWYTETTEQVTPETGDPYTRVIRTYNWNKSVQYCFGRKNTSVCQICGFRLTEGGLYLPTKFDECKSDIAALTQRVEELEALVIENQGS